MTCRVTCMSSQLAATTGGHVLVTHTHQHTFLQGSISAGAGALLAQLQSVSQLSSSRLLRTTLCRLQLMHEPACRKT